MGREWTHGALFSLDGGQCHSQTGPMSVEWTPEETAVLKAARRAREEDDATERAARGLALLALVSTVFERAHHRPQDGLRPGVELTRAIRLLARTRLFPEQEQLDARLDLLFEIIRQSPQRPVANCAALVVLELEHVHGWSVAPPRRAAFLQMCQTVRPSVMPLIALESQLDGGEGAANHLRLQPYRERRMRLLELVDVVDTYSDAQSIQPLVEETFEAIFEGLQRTEKSRLASRMVKELRTRRAFERHGRWALFIDPLLLANPGDAPLQESILDAVGALESGLLTPYVRFYLESIPPGRLRPEKVALAAKCGVSVLPFVRPLQDHRRFWGAQSPVAKAAQAAYAEIVAREGLAGVSGGLALVADGTEGALSMADAQPSALSIRPPTAARGDGGRSRWLWYGVGFSAAGTLAWQWMI